IADAVGAGALPHEVRAVHERAARSLADHGAEDVATGERRALHLAALGRHDEAAGLLATASERATRDGLPLQGEALARRARELARSSTTIVAAADALAAALAAQGRWTEALALDGDTVGRPGP